MLVEPEFQARLAALEFAIRRSLPSMSRGDRRAPLKKGVSLEFADFRNYVAGDDVRHLDWAGYARLDQLMIKLYHDEEDLQIHVLIDESRSMAYGEPSKATFARRVAAAIAYVGLVTRSRVSVVRLDGEEPAVLPLQRGSAAMAQVLDHLDRGETDSTTPIHESCRAYMARVRPRGAIVVVSDLLDPAGPGAVLRELSRAVTEVSVVQVMAPSELDPDLEGDLRLIDMETGHKVEVSLADAILQQYRKRARAFVADCAETSRRSGCAWALAKSDDDFEDFVLRVLVAEGVLR